LPHAQGVATVLRADDRAALAELVPALRRAVRLDERALVRLRLGPSTSTVLARLPFGVLVSRTVRTAGDHAGAADGADSGGPAGPAAGAASVRGAVGGSQAALDVTVRAVDALAWFDDPAAAPPPARDVEWRAGRPPETGWRPVDSVPDAVVRTLVRQGASALAEAAARDGVPGAQPRAEVADALLDTTVLTVRDDDGGYAEITLRALSALIRMGFLPAGGQVRVDIAGRWIRVVAGFGTVYLERAGHQLTVR
jgi:hypothetical protein